MKHTVLASATLALLASVAATTFDGSLMKRAQVAKVQARDAIAANSLAGADGVPKVLKKRMPMASVGEPVVEVAKREEATTTELVTPDNIAPGTYTVADGCIRYHTVFAGEICLGLLEYSTDIGLTLDELYCLNPDIDDLCYNLQIDTAYCIGYDHSNNAA